MLIGATHCASRPGFLGTLLASATPAHHATTAALTLLSDVQVLCLSVEPGFGGQKFQPEAMTKVRKLRDAYPALQLEVDGGISPSTIDQVLGPWRNDWAPASQMFTEPMQQTRAIVTRM